MGTIAVQALVNRSPEDVWRVLADFGNVFRASPVVEDSRLTSDGVEGVGMTRECELILPGAVVHERVTGWRENELLRVESYDGVRLPVKAMTVEFSLGRQGGDTVLRATMDYLPRGGLLSPLFDRVTRSRNERLLRLFVAGIKHRAETGEAVRRGVRVDIDAVQPAGDGGEP